MTGFGSPILIGGLAGSGKTRLRQALGAHPEVCLTRRTYLWPRYHGRFGDLRNPRNLTACLDVLARDPQVQTLRPDLVRIRSDLAARTPSYAHLFGLLHEHHAVRRGARRWGEQLGSIVEYADEVFAAYPDARMVHLVRPPTDGARAWPPWHRGSLPREAVRWARSAWLAGRNHQRHGSRYLVVRHRDLSDDPVAVLRTVCEFVGEPVLPPMEATVVGGPSTAGTDADRHDLGANAGSDPS